MGWDGAADAHAFESLVVGVERLLGPPPGQATDEAREAPRGVFSLADALTAPEDRGSIFISYSVKDRNRVTGLRMLLRGLGAQTVLQDHATSRPGQRWRNAIDAGIDKAGVLLVCWSENAAKSEAVRKEYEWFHGNRPDQPLIPLRMDSTPLPPLLSEYQWVDITGDI